MSMSELSFYPARRKKIIQSIIRKIEDNQGLTTRVLIGLLSTEYPYIAEETAVKYIKNLIFASKIKVNDEDVVSLCQLSEKK